MRYFVVNCKSLKYSTVYRRRVENNLLHSTFTKCYVYYTVKLHTGTELCLKYWWCWLSYCFLAWSVFVWYVIKIDIRPSPVSIFSDPVLSGQFLKSPGWPLYTSSNVKVSHFGYVFETVRPFCRCVTFQENCGRLNFYWSLVAETCFIILFSIILHIYLHILLATLQSSLDTWSRGEGSLFP